MVATDTVVGVAGAVVLALVMVGVFVYEYNNAPAAAPGGGTSETAKLAAFNAAYRTLNATDDLDGDGIANYLDADMDNFGGPDANQTGDLVVHVVKSGSVIGATPPATTSTAMLQVMIGHGNSGIRGFLNYTTATPAPASNPALQGVLKGAGPDDTTTGAPAMMAPGSMAASWSFSSEKGFMSGNATFTVTEASAVPTQATSFNAVFILSYGAAKPHVATV
ncbi:MAG: hypothetical protein V4510_08100 [bacterium]